MVIDRTGTKTVTLSKIYPNIGQNTHKYQMLNQINQTSHSLIQAWFLIIQYIPRNMHTVFALLCFVVVIHWLIFPYPSGLLHWHCGNLTKKIPIWSFNINSRYTLARVFVIYFYGDLTWIIFWTWMNNCGVGTVFLLNWDGVFWGQTKHMFPHIKRRLLHEDSQLHRCDPVDNAL